MRQDGLGLGLDRGIDQDLVEGTGGMQEFGDTVEACVEIVIAEQEAENAVVQLDEPGQSA
jgi:hypothetical protein